MDYLDWNCLVDWMSWSLTARFYGLCMILEKTIDKTKNSWLVELGEVIIGVRNELLVGLDDLVELCKG
jgi:hypothetical protein